MDEREHPITSSTPLYNSRIVDFYLRLLKRKYSYVDIDEVLEYAGMKAHEIADQGHWFSQDQIDRFHAIVSKKTNNENISREAGRYAASPEAIGTLHQVVLGLIDPAKVYERIGKETARFTKSSIYESKRLGSNTIEIRVTPRKGANEKPFQCENRIGFWEAIAVLFDSRLVRIEHPQCMFKGDAICRYIITWETQGSTRWKKARNIALISLVIGCLAFGLIDLRMALTTIVPISAIIFFVLTLKAEHLEKQEIKSILGNLHESSNELLEQIEANYNNSRLTHEIAESLATQTTVEGVLSEIIKLLKKRLSYDRGLIMLTNPQRSRLIFRGGYGYSEDKLQLLKRSAFHLERPDARGVFVACIKEQKPYLINDPSDIGHRLSPRSQAFAKEMGSHSFICCPIICESQSMGVLAVDNLRSKKPLVESDLILLQGIAHVIGISLRNAELIDDRDRQMQSILQTLAASIDARDPLTAGHSAKVTEYALGIAKELDLPLEYCEVTRVAALLHDYGKIGVPDAILKKPGRLTREEYEIVKTHATKSREILEQIHFSGTLSIVPEIVGAHHEKIDGSGYPLGLKGDQIPLGARIIAVADVFEAITAKRHYRDPLPVDVAFHLLDKERGVHFENRIVDALKAYYFKNIQKDQSSEGNLQKVS
jgi:HD-GYP domain-containing protein (c-di-GMP phosphodiesterase class II)